MRGLITLSLLLFTLIVGIACEQDRVSIQQQTDYVGQNSMSENPVEPNYELVKQHTYENREMALAEYADAIRALDEKINLLDLRISENNPEIGHDVKEGWKEDSENLKSRQSILISTYDSLKSATPKSWPERQEKFVEQWQELQPRWEGVRAE